MSKFDEAIEALKQARNGEEFKAAAYNVSRLADSGEQVNRFAEVVREIRELVFELDQDFKNEVGAIEKNREVQFKAYKASLDMEAQSELERYQDKYAEDLKNITSGQNLICPICRKETGFNIINSEIICSTCGHELVERDKMRDYNRAYRRAWKKPRS